MTVTLDGTGGIFTRLGKHMDAIVKAMSHATAMVETEPQDIDGAMNSASRYMIAPIIDNAEQMGRNVVQANMAIIRESMTNVLIEMVHADNPLSVKDVPHALDELITQMTANSESLNDSAISISLNAKSGNTGNGTIVSSYVNIDGNDSHPIRPEDIVATVVEDAQVTGTAGAEIWSVKGEHAEPDWHRDFPSGSSTDKLVVGCSATLDAGTNVGENRATNGDFEAFTTNAPDQWEIVTGTAGTTVDDIATPYRGTLALEITGNGAELTELRQKFGDGVAGTAAKLDPLRHYCLSFACRDGGVTPVAGVLRVSLRDGSDAEVASSAITVDLTSVGSTYARQSVVIRMPAEVPDPLYIYIELTTALTNTRTVLIDDLTISEMHAATPSGPWFSILSGPTDWVLDDRVTMAVSNDIDGDLARWMDQVFGMHAMGKAFPTSSSPTVSDVNIS